MGILLEDNVVFYHALESDGIEYTQQLVWASGNHVSGIIGDGLGGTDTSVTTTSGAYPSTDGDTAAAFAMWINNPGWGTVNVMRGYWLQVTPEETSSGTVKLMSEGEWVVTWEGTVAELLNSASGLLLDGSPHYLVSAFSHGASGWSLQTSLDGDPFVGRGVGAGSGDTTPSPGDPAIQLVFNTNDWVDEVVMWGGGDAFRDRAGGAPFTNQELSNLYELANTYGLTMDRYGSQYQNPSGSAGLFIAGRAAGEATTAPFDEFVKSIGFDPQLVGKLDFVGASGVFIQVYNVSDPSNTLAVSSSGCYPIGSTGRWGWSTANLPPLPAEVTQYCYRMTAPGPKIFDGQFRMVTKANRSHLPSINDILNDNIISP